MNRSSLLETAGRSFHQIVRLTLDQGNDNPMMQELNFAGMNSEGRQAVERLQAFGFTATPLPRSEQQGQQSSGGGTSGDVGGDGAQPQGPAAEGICLFVGGQRNHPVCIAIDDRRHRPMGLKPGENAQYDHNGQMTLIRSTGAFVLSVDGPDQSQQGGQTVQRMTSLRHVVKQPQKRPGGNSGNAQSGPSSGATGAKIIPFDSSMSGPPAQQEDYKHEGETVNTEVRLIKNTIDFRTGDNSIGSHTADSAKWTFGGKIHEVTSSDQHTVNSKQVSINGSNTASFTGKQVNISGSTGIAINGPASVNGKPVATTNMFDERDALIAKLTARIEALEARLG